MKRLKTMFFLILIISSNISLAFGATNEGYGEDEQALGQFVDPYTSLDNVSVVKNVVRNSTYDAMELNFSSSRKTFMDLTSYTEVDPNGDLTITSTVISFDSMREDANTYVWKDFGVGNLDDFQYELIINMATTEAGDASSPIQFGMLTMADNYGRINAYPNTYLTMFVSQQGSIDDTFRMGMRDRKGGANKYNFILSTIFNMSEAYYIIYNRSGVDSGLYVFRDSLRTDLIEKVTGVGWGDNYRWLHVLANKGQAGDGADQMTGTLSYYWNGTGGGGYELNGCFVSTDYLSSPIVNGSALVHLENTTIPPNTGITIEFSDDNATWILNDWQPLFGGFESIDLRELNYSTGYFTRHNLSTTDTSVTPRVYQSRLITTIGNSTGGGGGGPVVGGGINSATILMLILLFILAILVYWGIKRR